MTSHGEGAPEQIQEKRHQWLRFLGGAAILFIAGSLIAGAGRAVPHPGHLRPKG